MKSKSRQTRLSDAMSPIQDVVTAIEELDDDSTLVEMMELAEQLPPDASGVSELADEMESWRDNIEEKFSATQKYSDVSDCADALRDAADALEGVTTPKATKKDELKDELDEAKDEMQSALDDLDGVCFPGMFG